jgi:hypothetical protein
MNIMDSCEDPDCSANGGKKQCQNCYREKARLYSKEYRQKNKEKVRQSNQEYRDNNREKAREWNRNHFENNKERVRERARNNYQKYREDPKIKIIQNTRNRINKVLKRNTKGTGTKELLGCDAEFLKEWLQYQFDENMTWDNYGEYWHIDHVIPCDSFDVGIEEELHKCFNWKNLRPYKGSKNISKGKQIIPRDILMQEIKVKFYSKLKL